MLLDLYRLHQVALGERNERGCGYTTLFLVNVVNTAWVGETPLISIPIGGSKAPPWENLRYGCWLITALESVCKAMGAHYHKNDMGSAIVDGITVRIHMRGMEGVGIGNCGIVSEMNIMEECNGKAKEIWFDDEYRFLDPLTLSVDFEKGFRTVDQELDSKAALRGVSEMLKAHVLSTG